MPSGFWSEGNFGIACINKNPASKPDTGFCIPGSHGAGDLAGTEASCADIDMSGSAIHDCLDALHVGLPGAIGTAMGMGYLDTEHYAFVAKVALSHFAYLLLYSINSML